MTAPHVVEAFKQYDEGKTIAEIQSYFKEKGITNTKGRAVSWAAVQHMLSNRRYIGEYSFRDIVIPDGIPAIVPLDLFERVQEKLEKNKKAPARAKAVENYLLSTKIFCGHCGATMNGESGTGRNGTTHRYYKCHAVKTKKNDCKKKPVKKEWIEDLVVKETMDMLMDDDAIEAIVSIHAAAFTTLCIREAIAAGISTDTAYVIGDGYIGSMAQSKTFSDLTSLTLAMFEDFIYRVRKHRTNPNVSAQIRSCRDYIELHAEQELKLPELAKQAGYSEYYLSRKFKQEMGLSISTYIKYVRVERGKMMLVNSSIPIAQIADTLRFASSSHFSDSFREIVGKTPQQYRLDNQHF